MKDETNEPAFPVRGGITDNQFNGMTLRDYFAAKAMAALIGHIQKDPKNCGGKAVPTIAKFSYEYADAMLEARK